MREVLRVRVRLFARPREICGTDTLDLELPAAATASDCFAALASRHPELKSLREALMVAVNEEYAQWSTQLADGDVVALIPPVSGGGGRAGTLPR